MPAYPLTLALMRKAFIYVDNLRLGGFQRLALDQAYALSDRGLDVHVNVLSPSNTWTLAELECELVESKQITISEFPASRGSLAKKIHSQLHSIEAPLIISHSLRSTFALRVLRTSFGGDYTIHTTLHQLPGLTDPVQRFKRFIYAQFTDRLFCFSYGVKFSWENQFSFPFSSVFMKRTKKITVLRNGIYLERLPSIHTRKQTDRRPQIVFLGRLAFWKGLATIEKLGASRDLEGFDFMFMIPGSDSTSFDEFTRLLGERAKVVKGKTISSYAPKYGDVHIYPANYGPNVTIVESVSLNCLEMASIGIPSLVSSNGMMTWPEFTNSKFFAEANWDDISSVVGQIMISSLIPIDDSDIAAVRSITSIENQIDELLKLP